MIWRRRTHLIMCSVLLAGMTAVGCREDSSQPLEPDLAKGDRPGTQCQLGCVDPPPDVPDAHGYFLGSGVNPTACTNGSQTDTDQDGLSDFCEKNLGAAFSPQLYYAYGDEVGREPHWVARPLSTGVVRLGYLISYYRDAGNSSFGCDTFNWLDPSCGGHHGDSEAVYLDVMYNAKTQYWMLKTARYSQHGTLFPYDAVNCTQTYWAGCVKLYYPNVYRGYPRVYVAVGKHANYATRAECDEGGFGGSDTCYGVNTAARLPAGWILNLGSRPVHTAAQDCMVTTNPAHWYYGSGRTECYWTSKRFRGWVPTNVSGLDSDPYSSQLGTMGF